ncbi:MAG: KTSC domain-containing protein [Myxococcota bacterium]
MVERQQVTSRAIKSVGYNAKQSWLEIEFLSGALYRYRDVPRAVYDRLIASPSKGRFIARFVDSNYVSERIDVSVGTPPERLHEALQMSLDVGRAERSQAGSQIDERD